jgi:hypothetical protein
MVIPFSKSITQHKTFLSQPLGEGRANHTLRYISFKGITLNKKMCLDYESFRLPETSIFKCMGIFTK